MNDASDLQSVTLKIIENHLKDKAVSIAESQAFETRARLLKEAADIALDIATRIKKSLVIQSNGRELTIRIEIPQNN